MKEKTIALINEFGYKEQFEILDKQLIDNKEYIVVYPKENADGRVLIYKKDNNNYVPEDHMDIIEKVYSNFQKNSSNIKFIDNDKVIKAGEIVEFKNKRYICFKVIEFEGELFTYFISEKKPIDIKFTKQVFSDGEETKLEIIGDFYEKEKALSLLQRSNN